MKKKRLAETALALGTIVGGAANVPLLQQGHVQLRKYYSDTVKADAAQEEADRTPDPVTLAYARLTDAVTQTDNDWHSLEQANSQHATGMERYDKLHVLADDTKRAEERRDELVEAQKKVLSSGYETPQGKANILRVRADEGLDDVKRTGLELAFIDAGVALAIKELLKKKRENKLKSTLAGIETATAENRVPGKRLNPEIEASFRRQYEEELAEFMRGKRSI